MTDLVQDAQQTDIDSPPPFDLGEVEDTPEVVVDLGRLQDNITRAAAVADAHRVQLRPHVKTHKMPQVASLQIRAGAVGIQVAKLGEAEVFAQAGIADIFVGYPLVGSQKIARLIQLITDTDATISVAADSMEVAVPIARAAAAAGLQVPLLIEVDTGLRRLGVQPRQALNFARELADLGGIELSGLFTHEGHVYTDAPSAVEKQAMTQAACAAVAEAAERIRAEIGRAHV